MTEKEKCAKGLLYDANYDEDLLKERNLCKDICFEYNSTKPSLLHTKKDLLRKLFGKIDGDFTIQAPFWCDYGYNIELGKNFYANHNLIILDCAKVKFGDNVFIAPDCGFHTAGHPIDAQRRNQGLEYAWPITVGNNVVIGAGSVVTRNIPDNVIAVGNPCRVLREITEEELNTEKINFNITS